MTTAFEDTRDTRLGRAVVADAAAHAGQTGIYALPEPRDAFAARAVLAAGADRSIDAQYYIWHGDQAGMLLLESLWQAAARGVRVRVLLDDMNTAGLDPTLAAFDAHPNIEVRLYNPLAQRQARLLGIMADFGRLNRRMHNKSFTADGQVSVLGGRNIGNEYFAVGGGLAFSDLDVIAVGAAVREVSRQFDLYWNSPSAYPVSDLLPEPAAGGTETLQDRFRSLAADPDARSFIEAVRTTPFLSELLERRLPLEWTQARLLYDDPAKTHAPDKKARVLLFPELQRAMGPVGESLDMVSPYFVPGEDGTAGLAALARRGVRVRVLTNSLASSESSVVHSGYAKRRLDLLRAGVQLFEIKPSALHEALRGKPPVGSSSATALHAKTFAVDGKRIFVGSFNFDLRSAFLNTELGLVIESPALAGRLATLFDSTMPTAAYQAILAPGSDELEWLERDGEALTRHRTEPEAGWLRRLAVGLFSALPLDWLL